MRRSAAVLVSLFLATLFQATLLCGPTALAAGQNRRIVAVGDVHGAYDALRAILLEAALIDPEGNWAGGEAVLVQTGDFLDRGADSVRVAFWLMELQRQAPVQGGEVIVLLGNHESMNLMGDMRFVPPEMLEPMIDADSEKRRLQMCKERVTILRRSAKALKQKALSATALRAACLKDHPLGLVEYQEALRPGAPLGDWLRSLPVIASLDGTLFVHGGLSPDLEIRDVAEINRTVRQEVDTFERWRRWLVDAGRMVPSATLTQMARAVQVELELRRLAVERGEAGPPEGASDLSDFYEMSDRLLLSQYGPLWFRGYDSWSEEEGLEKLPKILASFGAGRVVVGHTPQESRRVSARFGGRAFLIDTGMLKEYYEGMPAALEIEAGRVEVIYLDERQALPAVPTGEIGEAGTAAFQWPSATSTWGTSSSTVPLVAWASGSNS